MRWRGLEGGSGGMPRPEERVGPPSPPIRGRDSNTDDSPYIMIYSYQEMYLHYTTLHYTTPAPHESGCKQPLLHSMLAREVCFMLSRLESSSSQFFPAHMGSPPTCRGSHSLSVGLLIFGCWWCLGRWCKWSCLWS